MNKVIGLLSLCVVLAIMKAVLIALAIALLLALAYSVVTRPRETLLFLGALTLTGLASARPAVAIVALGVLGVALVAANAKRKSRSQLLLTDGREHHSKEE